MITTDFHFNKKSQNFTAKLRLHKKRFNKKQQGVAILNRSKSKIANSKNFSPLTWLQSGLTRDII